MTHVACISRLVWDKSVWS